MPCEMLLLTVTFLTLAAFLLPPCSAQRSQEGMVRYDNHSVFKLKLKDAEQRVLLEQLLNHNGSHFSIWHSTAREMDLMVAPDALNYFQNVARFVGAKSELMIPNVQRILDEELAAVDVKANRATFDWTRYYNLATIEAWLDGILAQYPQVTEGFTIGQSYEGRHIRGIKISYKSGNPGIFIESNIHAREWITSATATWFINELLSSTRPEVRALAENHDWYIVPVLNVDGFAYTHEKDRLWRKTRQPVAISPCIGADANRNFDSHWMANNGASSDPCAETYAGTHPFSEPEVKALANFVAGIKDRLNIMLAFHSYSQLLLSPYGHTSEEFPANFDDLMAVAKAYADAVAGLPYGTQYEYGSFAGALYVGSGATNDWAYNEQDIKISYTIEFRDQGRFGFVLPPVQIIPNAEEALAGILALVGKSAELGYLKVKY